MADDFQMLPEQRRDHNRAVAQMRINIQTTALRCDHWQSCMNCDHFTEGIANGGKRLMPNEQPAFCTLYKATPPAHVIVNGCTDWQMDIPF